MTAQRSDIIIIEGQNHRMFCEPLEDYWNETNPKPNFIPVSTDCWRGYCAIWEILEKKLYFIDIKTENLNLRMNKVFPDNNSAVFAEWFSGELRIPQGEMLEYVHKGYGSKYEKDLFLMIENGSVMKQHIMRNIRS